MNDSNQTLRFSRSYHEATGRRIYPSDFEQDTPRITGKGALFWTGAAVMLATLAAIFAR